MHTTTTSQPRRLTLRLDAEQAMALQDALSYYLLAREGDEVDEDEAQRVATAKAVMARLDGFLS